MKRWSEWVHLSERAFADTSQEDEMKEVDIAFEVDGLQNETGRAGTTEDSLWGDSKRHPLGR